MTAHKTGTHEEWLAARGKLLEREKELTRMGDELARQRRELPWVPVEKEYTFARESDTVYHCYSSSARGVEFLMGYYPILDRTPKGRDEGDAFQTWLRRHDEYDSQ